MTRASEQLTELLGINAPIVLGPFGGLSSPELTATVSELGGLGSFGLYGYSPERIEQAAEEIRDRTDRPFALNLWVPTGDEVAPVDAELDHLIATITPFFDELGIAVPDLPERFLPDFDEQVDAVIAARPAVLSLVYGPPSTQLVDRARAAGVRLVGTATTVDEAAVLAAAGVDAVVATGAEAAGHRVSFLRPPEESLVGGFALVPQVVDAVGVPVIAAGAVADRRGVAAALALGAAGVQVGTAFLRTVESAANAAHRAAIDAASAESTVLTRAMSGRLARGAPNRAIRTIEAADAVGRFPAQNWLTGAFRAVAGRQGVGDLQSLWLGQAAPLAKGETAAAVFRELAAGLAGDR